MTRMVCILFSSIGRKWNIRLLALPFTCECHDKVIVGGKVSLEGKKNSICGNYLPRMVKVLRMISFWM